MKRPTRSELGGHSLSEFKTFLKIIGHKVPRNLDHVGYITEYSGRYFRWRWWSDEGFVVDRSKPAEMFDRWANSVEETYSFKSFLEQVESE